MCKRWCHHRYIALSAFQRCKDHRKILSWSRVGNFPYLEPDDAIQILSWTGNACPPCGTSHSSKPNKGRIAPQPKVPHAPPKICIARAFDPCENGCHANRYWASRSVPCALDVVDDLTPLLRLSGAEPDSQSSDDIHVTFFRRV